MKTVLIVGAGFCGTLAAVSLLRHPPAGPTRIVLLNRSGLLARGVAYGTRSEGHVLNVPAGRMSAFPGDEDHFLRFAQRLDARVTAAAFVPRAWYGQYLESLLTDAVRKAVTGCSFRCMVGEALRLRLTGGGSAALVELDQGETVSVDRVILALGNYAPANPTVPTPAQAFFRSPRYVRDPWRPEALRVAPLAEPVLLIGTGLTMLDVLLDLRARGHTGMAYALSRRGLLPLAHRELEAAPVYTSLMSATLTGGASVLDYLRAVRWKVEEARRHGADWRDVIGALRPRTPALWRALAPAERRRFLRHLRPFWDVHRHRCAPAAAEMLHAERDRGSLRVVAGRLTAFAEKPDGVEVRYRPRGSSREQSLNVSAVINCTGPENDTRTLQEPLLAQLREQGLAVPDEHGLGLQIGDDYALLDRAGAPSRVLYYVGPFLRARDWEATAVPELRSHVRLAAEHVRRSLGDDPGVSVDGLEFA